MKIKAGGVRQGLDAQQYYIENPVTGQVATDGIQYSAVTTFGTADTEVWNALINPGFQLENQWLKVGITQSFTGLPATSVASISYYLRGRNEWFDLKGAIGTLRTSTYATLSALYQKAVGTALTSEDSLMGNISVGTISKTPFRLSLMARGSAAAIATGKVKNSTYIELVGNIIPGA